MALGAGTLLVALGYAAYRDVRSREVDDSVWLVLAVVGAGLQLVVRFGDGAVPFVLWVLVAGFVLEHIVPWDVRLERLHPSFPGIVEAVLYGGVGVALVVAGLTVGLGPSDLPLGVVAVYVMVLVARALFEFGILYGGADAKAIMVAALVLPLDPTPVLGVPTAAGPILAVYPFALTLLMDAALLAVVVPVALAARNLAAGTFDLRHGFTSFRLAVAELPRRFVWLRDPTWSRTEEADVETSEEDAQLRGRQAHELEARGVREVWVTPQLPFILFLWAGAVAAVVVGNLLFDLFALF